MRLADNMSKLAAELVHEPIDVFGVCPGATDTEMFRSSTLKGMNEKELRRFCSRPPKGRLIPAGGGGGGGGVSGFRILDGDARGGARPLDGAGSPPRPAHRCALTRLSRFGG